MEESFCIYFAKKSKKKNKRNRTERFSLLKLFPGGGLGIPTDRDQQSWVFLNNPKNTLPLKNTFRESPPLGNFSHADRSWPGTSLLKSQVDSRLQTHYS